jgi:hypothetical protein
MKELTPGIMLFEKTIKHDVDILNFLNDITEKELKKNYSLETSIKDNKQYFVNASGHRFLKEDIEKNCVRLSAYFQYEDSSKACSYFLNCEKLTYFCLLEYIEKYPMLLPCIWWKTKGHPLVYKSGSMQGLHCDNDINYMPNHEPMQQLGSRHVLASITYLNEDYVGGEIVFPYLGIKYKPKSGDTLMFPSNFMYSHQVKDITSGTRYAYLQYFGQGSSDTKYGISIADDDEHVFTGQVWLKNIFSDYKKFIVSRHDNQNSGPFLLPLQRSIHSAKDI